MTTIDLCLDRDSDGNARSARGGGADLRGSPAIF